MKLHARVTKCIDVTKEEMDIVVKASTCGESILNDDEKKILNGVKERLMEGIDAGNYEAGYIPGPWIEADSDENGCINDIEI